MCVVPYREMSAWVDPLETERKLRWFARGEREMGAA